VLLSTELASPDIPLPHLGCKSSNFVAVWHSQTGLLYTYIYLCIYICNTYIFIYIYIYSISSICCVWLVQIIQCIIVGNTIPGGLFQHQYCH
jgi:hypothetical protein